MKASNFGDFPSVIKLLAKKKTIANNIFKKLDENKLSS